jgi:hypothetical protein
MLRLTAAFAMLALAAIPTLAATPTVSGSSTMTCYDAAGKVIPCNHVPPPAVCKNAKGEVIACPKPCFWTNKCVNTGQGG